VIKACFRWYTFKCVVRDGVAHADDTLAAALFYRAGAEFIYRYSSEEEILGVEGDVVVFDVGDEFRHRLPPRFVVLDHHGVADPAQEPSSVVQAALAVGARFTPLVQKLAGLTLRGRNCLRGREARLLEL